MRPHLVLDGAEIAAQSVGATEIVIYVGAAHGASWVALERAIAERGHGRRRGSIRMVAAPHAYVAGEESAAVHFINEGDARPTSTPPRPFEAGLDGRPTLVQNVETLAMVALIARHGAEWFRELGRGGERGSSLVTVSNRDGMFVHEIEIGTRVGELVGSAGGRADSFGAVLLGGYFGTWSAAQDAWGLPLDSQMLRAAGLSFGAGVVSFLGRDECGIRATADILDFMAGQSAAQCGPCVFGLRAMADVAERVGGMNASDADVGLLERWSQQLVGRGACRHPDGAAGLLISALTAFAPEFDSHVRFRRCTAVASRMAA
jgi:NADH:ubiquinone oxidoreductase subunit F (NADH-binding)